MVVLEPGAQLVAKRLLFGRQCEVHEDAESYLSGE
jgi:hypothetical protein